jgi:hypothetical protein
MLWLSLAWEPGIPSLGREWRFYKFSDELKTMEVHFKAAASQFPVYDSGNKIPNPAEPWTGVVFFILSPQSNLAYIGNYTEDPPLKHA